MHVLVLGATGYVGGRLVPELLAAGHRVRCAVRTPAKLEARPWRDRVDFVPADVTDPNDMARAVAGVDAVVYLIRAVDGRPDLAAAQSLPPDGFAAAVPAFFGASGFGPAAAAPPSFFGASGFVPVPPSAAAEGDPDAERPAAPPDAAPPAA